MAVIAEPESSGYLACVGSTKSNSDTLSAVGVSSNASVANYFKSAEWYAPFMSKFSSVYITELPIF